MKTRAQAGGEIGINGEKYGGGQFLPSSPSTIKGINRNSTRKSNRTGKQEVAPYKWEVAPANNQRSIFTMIVGIFGKIDRNTGTLEFTASEKTLQYFNRTEKEITELINRFNNGEKWATV